MKTFVLLLFLPLATLAADAPPVPAEVAAERTAAYATSGDYEAKMHRLIAEQRAMILQLQADLAKARSDLTAAQQALAAAISEQQTAIKVAEAKAVADFKARIAALQ